MTSILITGGTGLIGKHLSHLLRAKGYTVSVLSRDKTDRPNTFYWNLEDNFIDPKAIRQANYIIHLAGANIAKKRWTKKQRKLIISSRVHSTNLLFKKVKELNPTLKGFIVASGIGYYGATTCAKIFTEQDTPGEDFISTVCKLWEKASLQFNSINVRTVIFRTGVVFSKNGGAFNKLSKPIKLGLGAIIGSGEQYTPWIHIEDLCQLYVHAIENSEIQGVYNAVAPEHITNKSLIKSIATITNKRLWLPNIPAFFLKLILGEMAVIILEGSRISFEKIKNIGFKFSYPTLNLAIDNLTSLSVK